MNIVDSSGWLEYFEGSKSAKYFASLIKDPKALLVPVITIYEVFKRVLVQRGHVAALQSIAYMTQGEVVEVDTSLCIQAAHLSVQHDLPMADSLILATAQQHQATIWTMDSDFKGIQGVKYYKKA